MVDLITRAALVFVLKFADCFTTALILQHGGTEYNPGVAWLINRFGIPMAMSSILAGTLLALIFIVSLVKIDKNRYTYLARTGLQILFIVHVFVVLYDTFAYSVILGA